MYKKPLPCDVGQRLCEATKGQIMKPRNNFEGSHILSRYAPKLTLCERTELILLDAEGL